MHSAWTLSWMARRYGGLLLLILLIGLLCGSELGLFLLRYVWQPQSTFTSEYDAALAYEGLHYCRAAYCPEEQLVNWSCGEACGGDRSDFDVRAVYSNESYGTLGYVGLHHASRRIVIAFRGSANTANWISNMKFLMTPYPDPSCGPDCAVHRGFYQSYLSIRDTVVSDVLMLHRMHPKYSLFATGHSLGAAIAMLCAIDLSTLSPQEVHAQLGVEHVRGPVAPLALYTFGEPRVGNEFLVAYAAAVLSYAKQFRLVNGRDPVPHLPPRSWGYIHLPQEMWTNVSGSDNHNDDDGSSCSSEPVPADKVLVQCNDSTISEDPECSNSVWATAVSDHLIYLGICTRCTCTPQDYAEIEAEAELTGVPMIAALHDYWITQLGDGHVDNTDGV